MLGVVHHMEKWRCPLEGVHFTVVTEHQPNTWSETAFSKTSKMV